MAVSQGQYDEILDLLARLDITARQEHLGGSGGGLCSMQGRQIFFVDLDADPATRLDAALGALASLPAADGLYLPPNLRDELDRRRTAP